MPAKLVLISSGTGERREDDRGAEAVGIGVPGALESMISSAPIFSWRPDERRSAYGCSASERDEVRLSR
jgi:hypothetical protein